MSLAETCLSWFRSTIETRADVALSAVLGDGVGLARKLALGDVFLLRHLEERGVRFDLSKSLVHPATPSQAALVGLLTRYRFGAVTCIHDEDGQGGFVQVWPHGGSLSWHLLYALSDERPCGGHLARHARATVAVGF